MSFTELKKAGIAFEISSPEQRKRNLFFIMLKDEFLREFQFLSEVVAGRATQQSKFTQQLVKQLNKVAAAADPMGTAAEVVNILGEVPVFTSNRANAQSLKIVVSLGDKFDLRQLVVLLDVVAQEAFRRYEDFILGRLSDDPSKGILPFARVGARRMLEYLSRNALDITSVCLSEAILLTGLIEGRSGRWLKGFFNTTLELKRYEQQSGKPNTIEAEVVFARSGFRYFEINNGECVDQLFLRNTPAKHQTASGWEKAKTLFTGDVDAFYNFGYVEYRKTKGCEQDPKEGYVLMPLLVIKDCYEYKEVEYEAMSTELKLELRSSSRSIVQIDSTTISKFIKFWIVDPKNKGKGLVDYIKTICPNVERVICRDDLSGLSLKGLNLANADFSEATLTGSLEGTNFDHCYLIGAAFKNITSLKGASLREARCDYLQAVGVDFKQSDLTQTTFSYANLSKADLRDCDTLGAIWFEACLDGAQTNHVFQKSDKNLRMEISKQLKNAQEEINQRLNRFDQEVQSVMGRADNLELSFPVKDKDALLQLVQQHSQETQNWIVFEVHCEEKLKYLVEKMKALTEQMQGQNTEENKKENMQRLKQLQKECREIREEIQQLREIKRVPPNFSLAEPLSEDMQAWQYSVQEVYQKEAAVQLKRLQQSEQTLEDTQKELLQLQKQATETSLSNESLTPSEMHTFEDYVLLHTTDAPENSASVISSLLTNPVVLDARCKQITWAAVDVSKLVEEGSQQISLRKKLTRLFATSAHCDAIAALSKQREARRNWVEVIAERVKHYQEVLLEGDNCDEEIYEAISDWFQAHEGTVAPPPFSPPEKTPTLIQETKASFEAEKLAKQQQLEIECLLEQKERIDLELHEVGLRRSEIAKKRRELEAKLKEEENQAIDNGGEQRQTRLEQEAERGKEIQSSTEQDLAARLKTSEEALKVAIEAEARLRIEVEAAKQSKELSLQKHHIEVSQLLEHVVAGEQTAAEAMLKNCPDLALSRGDVCDLSGRHFKEITSFQYAVWALDWHMWRMLLKYLPPVVAGSQYQELAQKGTAHARHFSLTPLIEELKMYVKNFLPWSNEQCDMYWCEKVGGNQWLLPPHVAQEYCHMSRSFVPCPEFNEEERNEILTTDVGNWYTSEYNGGKLGKKFGFVRGGLSKIHAMNPIFHDGKKIDIQTVEEDLKALQSLWTKRQLQLATLQDELRKYASPEQFHDQNSSEMLKRPKDPEEDPEEKQAVSQKRQKTLEEGALLERTKGVEKDSLTLAKEYLAVLIDNSVDKKVEVEGFGVITCKDLTFEVIKLAPDLARPYNVLGVHIQDKETVYISGVGSFTNRSAFLKAIELDKKLERAYSNLATCLGKNERITIPDVGEMDKKELFLKTIGLNPEYAPAYNGLVDCLTNTDELLVPHMEKVGKRQLLEKYYKLCPPSGDSDLIYLVRGNDDGRPAWYYILVHKLELVQFLLDLKEEIIHLERRGTILKSAYGTDPPASVTADIKKLYNIVD